ncbi:MAG TPA: undecaprenyldiphospho-muramoylpentapeptide beta-N-acetylglucosaminyltransferase [Smithellaceae bacterium]|nr:undecaprenyldiphospho-muramoylpentapeptide beta-N-acetylglucosaminyltransferase [Smithellaceae bacterium]HRS89593.1 undecaprenyldiphospho-muramoylpentapeptide beta-N-acetylglucosaminyltransferase [Smithellaceae bacterium]HRV26346.1 undecaprenyldiphospho-muramoylpentapeptide beta-N-acetylglucosaminyltransferase [Smithellaceae bacterium]
MRVIIAGGGTGGHLFPGIALAEEFLKRSGEAKILFIGTQRGMEAKLLPQLGFELKTIDVEGIKGRGLGALVKSVYQIPVSMWQSRGIIKEFKPNIVIGVGGYASGPAVIAAYLMKIPTAIAEQNALPGLTNRILGKFVKKIFVTYQQTARYFPPAKVMVSGNPVRAAFAAINNTERDKKDCRQLLVFGGSQGAEAINRAIIRILPRLQKMKRKICIIHQTGTKQADKIKKVYEKYAMKAHVLPFIVDMVKAYKSADLIICRAGATSLAEITAAGRAAILIPYPYAANDHQAKNARAMAEAGAAVVLYEHELSDGKLYDIIEELLIDEKKIRQMEAKAASLGNIKAAANIVDTCIKLMA